MTDFKVQVEQRVLNSDRSWDVGCTDWTLHEDAESVWITAGNISVYIKRLDEGAVSVELFDKGVYPRDYIEALDVYDKGDECRDYIDGCYAEPRT